MSEKKQKRIRRHRRIRAKISGDSKTPRLCVFRSSKHISVQLIDDEKGKTLFSMNDKEIKAKGKTEKAKELGKAVAKAAIEKKMEKVVFDRAGFQYHGRVKAVAEGAREGGLKF